MDANNGEPAVDLDGHSGATAALDQSSASGPDEAGIGEAIEVAFGVGMTVLEGAALAWSDLFPVVDDTDWQLETTVYEAARDILNRITEIDTDEGDLMPAKGLALEDQTTKGVFVAEDYFLPEPGIDHGLRKTELGAGLGDIDVLDVVSEGSGGVALDTSSAADTESAPVETTQTTIPASGAHFVDVVALARYGVSNADLAQAVFAGQEHQFNLG